MPQNALRVRQTQSPVVLPCVCIPVQLQTWVYQFSKRLQRRHMSCSYPVTFYINIHWRPVMLNGVSFEARPPGLPAPVDVVTE